MNVKQILSLSVSVSITFIKSSKPGRAYLISLFSHLKSLFHMSHKKDRNILVNAGDTLKTFLFCDRHFHLLADQDELKNGSRSIQDLYLRMVPFAWISLELRKRFYEAFGLQVSDKVLERMFYFCLSHREWNDLTDHFGYSPQTLYSALLQKSEDPDLNVLYRIRKHLDVIVPKETFPNYYKLISISAEIQGLQKKSTPETVKDDTEKRSFFASQLMTSVAFNQVENSVMAALKAFSFWLYILDDFADLKKDRGLNRLTFLSLVEHPEKELMKYQNQLVRIISETAINAKPCVSLIKLLNHVIVKAVDNDISIEEQLLGESQ